MLKYIKECTQKNKNRSEDVLIHIVKFLDCFLQFEGQVLNEPLILLNYIKNLLLSNCVIIDRKNSLHVTFLSSALNILNKILPSYKEWNRENIGDLLGIGISYMSIGLDGINIKYPKKIHVSQQNISELEPSHLELDLNKGGKLTKKRKPRVLVKGKHESTNQGNYII